MSEVKLSTFSSTEQHFATLEPPITEPQAIEPTVSEPTAVVVEPTTEPSAVVEPTTEPTEVDYSTSSFSLGGEEPATDPTAEPTTAAPAPKAFNLDEELAKVDKKELAKKLGFNDFVLELNDHLASGGSALDYLNARAIDYNQVSDENIIKSDLKKQFPTFTDEQIDKYYSRTYGVNEFADDDEKEFMQLKQKADAHKLRQSLIDQQKQFKVPDAITPVKDEAYERWKQYSESQSQVSEQINNFYLNHAATKNLHENKKVAINVGEGIAPFNVVIDKPELITKSFTDGGDTWQKLTTTQTGEPDVQKQQMIALFTFNPQKFIQDLFNYGLQQGKRSLVSEGQNAQKPKTAMSPLPQDEKPTYSTGRFGDRARN
jgi:hypothetical protein